MRASGLSQPVIAVLVAVLLMISVALVYLSQALVEKDAFLPPAVTSSSPNASASSEEQKKQFEMAKLAAEIRQIRSDTGGSLFWLKMMALFVTVGGAVGGYLLGQSQATQKRIAFEDRKNIDAAYQAIVQELSSGSQVLRAAAAVKLGAILRAFPSEWDVSDERRAQLIQLTKQVLPAALAIEQDAKVLKTLSIAIGLHQPWIHGRHPDPNDGPDRVDPSEYSDLRGIDLSGAKATDAYWARVDFSNADFFKAICPEASFRKAILRGTQLREADLHGAVFIEARCQHANFKMADLRGANFTSAWLDGAKFEHARVAGAVLSGVQGDIPDTMVDISDGDTPRMTSLHQWMARPAAAD